MSQAIVFTRVLWPDPLTFKPARSLRNAMGNVFGTWGKRIQKCLEFIIIVLTEVRGRLLWGEISSGDQSPQCPICSFPPSVADASLSQSTTTKPSGELQAASAACPAMPLGNVFEITGDRGVRNVLEFIIIVLTEVWGRLLWGEISSGDSVAPMPDFSFPPSVANASLSQSTTTRPSGELTAPPCPAAT